MSRTYCNASVPRPGHTGERLSCSIVIHDGAAQHYSDHWRPVSSAEGGVHHGRGAHGFSWSDATGGAIPHDPATAEAVPATTAELAAQELEATGVRFTRVEVQRAVSAIRLTAPEELSDIADLLEARLRDHDERGGY